MLAKKLKNGKHNIKFYLGNVRFFRFWRSSIFPPETKLLFFHFVFHVFFMWMSVLISFFLFSFGFRCSCFCSFFFHSLFLFFSCYFPFFGFWFSFFVAFTCSCRQTFSLYCQLFFGFHVFICMFMLSTIFILSFGFWICVSCSLCPNVALCCLVFVSCLCLQLHSNCFFCKSTTTCFQDILAEEQSKHC